MLYNIENVILDEIISGGQIWQSEQIFIKFLLSAPDLLL